VDGQVDFWLVCRVPELGHEGPDGRVVDVDGGGVDEEADRGDWGFGAGRGGGGLGAERGEVVGEGAGDFPRGVDGVVFFEGLGWMEWGFVRCDL
jgi:hypothetical protein